ncbi:bile acid:sodium symporter family protein [Otariodibacter sp.]|uniref:bile acid:sodium symporter family protein n=1 Tax=Otariodibacter sp. TaxID=3030919 RepID=UPI0026155E2B|nr:bile acid:sodium symporter family protein [Otariodibacter sp.]
MNFLVTIAKQVQKHFAIFTIIVAIIAFYFPQVFLWASSYLNLGMIIVMFGMSLTMEFDDFKELVKRPKTILVGVVSVFVVSSIVVYGIVNVISLPVGLAIGLLLCGATPGGVITNVLTFISDGDVSLSVGLTSLGTLLAPIFMPLLSLLLVGQMTEVDGGEMIASVLLNVVLPLVVGLTIKALFRETAVKISEFSPLFSLLALALMVGIIVGLNKQKLIESLDIKLFIAVVLFILIPTIISFGISKIFHFGIAQARATAIEVGFKNTILASIIASNVFKDFPEAALPGIIIAVISAVLGPVIGNYWANLGGGIRAEAEKQQEAMK